MHFPTRPLNQVVYCNRIQSCFDTVIFSLSIAQFASDSDDSHGSGQAIMMAAADRTSGSLELLN